MTDFLNVLKIRKNRYRKQWFSNFLRGSKKIFFCSGLWWCSAFGNLFSGS